MSAGKNTKTESRKSIVDCRITKNDVTGRSIIEILCPFCHNTLAASEAKDLPETVPPALLVMVGLHVALSCPGKKD